MFQFTGMISNGHRFDRQPHPSPFDILTIASCRVFRVQHHHQDSNILENYQIYRNIIILDKLMGIRLTFQSVTIDSVAPTEMTAVRITLWAATEVVRVTNRYDSDLIHQTRSVPTEHLSFARCLFVLTNLRLLQLYKLLRKV